MQFTIHYYSEAVQADVMDLPVTLAARYIALSRRMTVSGPNLGEPHTKAMGDGLFEMRLKGAEGIARVLPCVVLHAGGAAHCGAAQLHQKNRQNTPPGLAAFP